MAARMATEEEARSDWLGAKAPEPPCSDGPLRRCLDAVVQEGCQTKHRCRRDDDPREGAYLCAVDCPEQHEAGVMVDEIQRVAESAEIQQNRMSDRGQAAVDGQPEHHLNSNPGDQEGGAAIEAQYRQRHREIGKLVEIAPLC